jgi:hypothetical protein
MSFSQAMARRKLEEISKQATRRRVVAAGRNARMMARQSRPFNDRKFYPDTVGTVPTIGGDGNDGIGPDFATPRGDGKANFRPNGFAVLDMSRF